MKPALQLRLSQQLTMTPQLQQAIKLLQLSSQELETHVLEALESNPLLDREEEIRELAPQDEQRQANGKDTIEEPEGVDRYDADDGGWDQQYHEMPIPSSGPARREAPTTDRAMDYPDRDNEADDLTQHLLWQLNLCHLSHQDTAIGVTLIEAINEDGYLSESLEEIQESMLPDYDVELDEIEAVLHQIQRFDPVGVGAAGVRDCLEIQLSLLPEDTPALATARAILEDHLDLLAKQDLRGLRRALAVSDEHLQTAIDLVRSLDPRPGSRISSEPVEYVRPDVMVRKMDGRWRVMLNDEFLPRLAINNYYSQLIAKAQKDDATYLKGQLQEARWLIKSLETRNDTLLKVANAIVEHQQEFFDRGPEAMKPLVLREIAEIIDMHESTVSRVTSRKYMLTPRGVFEFKYFFSSQVNTADGGGCSATAIQAMIQKLVDEEKPEKPLSDSKLATILNERGIDVARRTVAKYRETLNIPSSSQRKRLL